MLRIMAISAPHWISDGGNISAESLDSLVPFSLLNAIRMAAGKAEAGVGAWGKSNWHDKEIRRHSIKLMTYFKKEHGAFLQKISEIRPHLLLIGSMTLAFPGAIALAKTAKEVLGNEVFVVLGGKHALETVYEKNGRIEHHAGSPLKLMAEGTIPRVFDLVVAGDGEEIIVEIGEVLDRMHKHNMSILRFGEIWEQLLIANGKWIAGRVEGEKILTIQSNGIPIDYSQIPSVSDLFVNESKFKVFEKSVTAHAYSYGSKGCIHNCNFCSERVAVNGKPVCQKTTPFNLLKDFACIARRADGSNTNNSLFVEDSILLSGDDDNMETFYRLLDLHKIKIRFGCQLTMDKILRQKTQDTLMQLRKYGLEYIFWGLETANTQIASSLSKNTQTDNWLEKNEAAIRWIADNGLKCGTSVMFGLGETQSDRILLLSHLCDMKKQYGKPEIVSMNVATQHPLQGQDGGANYNYTRWGTAEDSPYLPLFVELFGEASVLYQIPGKEIPSSKDLHEIREFYRKIKYIRKITTIPKSNKNCIMTGTLSLQKLNQKGGMVENRVL